jgi:16S rRNA (guanine1207-N2)-methyltransferase
MKNLLELLPVVEKQIVPPVLVALGPVWPVTQLVSALKGAEAVCFQFDVYQAERLREKLKQENLFAEVVTAPDLWDLPPRFRTVIFLAAAHSDYELKLDIVEQGFHVLEPGGKFVTLSEYERDSTFSKLHKKVFGKCSEAPRSEFGSAFWSTREPGDQPRRRHRLTFHAKIGDRASMSFESWPGTFTYGRMDDGSRAMLEVADVRPGDKVLDMGCGCGAVGCLASPQCGPTGEITFVDSSVRAIKLTEMNATANAVPRFKLVTSSTMSDLPVGEFDVVLANPPYFANSEVGRLFIHTAREVLRPGGRFYFVTKMPVRTIPEIVESFGSVESVENRGYTVVMARA